MFIFLFSQTSGNDGPNFFLPNKNLYTHKHNIEYTPGLGIVRYNHAMQNLIPIRSKTTYVFLQNIFLQKYSLVYNCII